MLLYKTLDLKQPKSIENSANDTVLTYIYQVSTTPPGIFPIQSKTQILI